MSDVIEEMVDDEPEGQAGAPEVPEEILHEALEQGWVPQDKWTGRPEEWSDAETFVRRGREINPILRKALKKERERTAALEAQLRSTGATVAELREYLAKVEERATKNALAQLKKARSEALASGDHEAAASYEEQMDQLKDSPSAVPKAPEPVAQPQQMHPDVVAWMGRNPWYSEDNPEMVEYADGAVIRALSKRQASKQTVVPSEVLEEVTEKVKRMFPDHFRGSSPAASMFEAGGSRSGSRGSASVKPSSGFSSLPKSAQAQFQRFYDAGYYVDIKTGKKLDLAAAQTEYFKEYE